MTALRTTFLAVAVSLASTVAAGSAHAQRFGGQLSWGSDSDVGLGARAEFPLTNMLTKTGVFSRAFIVTQFDWYFVDCPSGVDCTYWELNPTFAVPLQTTTLRPYLGAGLNIAHASVEVPGFGSGSETETGVNLLGGLKFTLGGAEAFSEARVSLGGGEQFALSFGFLFGGSRR